jgi:hypothetical protein
VIYSALDDRADMVISEALFVFRSDRASVHSYSYSAGMFTGCLGYERDLISDGAALLVVMEMAGVVSNLVYVWRDIRDESVALLKVHREEGLCLAPNLRQASDVFFAVDGDAYEVSASRLDDADLPERCRDVTSLRGGHALYGYRRVSTYGETANVDLACLALGNHSMGIVLAEG